MDDNSRINVKRLSDKWRKTMGIRQDNDYSIIIDSRLHLAVIVNPAPGRRLVRPGVGNRRFSLSVERTT